MRATDVVTDLVERFIPLATNIARKWAVHHPALADDFESDALFALWKSAEAFKPRTDHPLNEFVKYARQYISWALCRRLTCARRKRLITFGDVPDDCPSPIETIPDDAPEVGSVLEAAELVHQVFANAKLSAREYAIFLRHVVEGERFSDMAANEGVSGTRCRQIHDDAQDKLRRAAGRGFNPVPPDGMAPQV